MKANFNGKVIVGDQLQQEIVLSSEWLRGLCPRCSYPASREMTSTQMMEFTKRKRGVTW